MELLLANPRVNWAILGTALAVRVWLRRRPVVLQGIFIRQAAQPVITCRVLCRAAIVPLVICAAYVHRRRHVQQPLIAVRTVAETIAGPVLEAMYAAALLPARLAHVKILFNARSRHYR